MFGKILVANRGEIACRILKTCRRMGIIGVAVHSEADERAPHVRMADEAVHIGPPTPAESYLAVDRIVDAVRQTGADAVHPGYGFLSENAAFVEAVEAAGAVFIGPPTAAVATMGDKIEAKRLATEAGVSVVPGSIGEILEVDEALKEARAIGYPVMMKPAAGGGGKGMRLVLSDDDVREGFRAARSEANSAFGDGRIFLEKFIENPRHVEIQLLADGHGNVVALNERECSIQRRHQKIVEEAPSPLLDAATRRTMGEQALCAGARRGLPIGGHGRVRRRPGSELLLPGDEHAPAGRTSGHRMHHGSRSGGADDPHRRGREAGVRPERCRDRRLGRRGACLCRGSAARLPAVDRPP